MYLQADSSSLKSLGFSNKVSFAISFTAISVIFMDLGMSTYATREIAKHKEVLYKYMNNIFQVLKYSKIPNHISVRRDTAIF